ncbi:hypothetical protein [Sphingomonas sp. BK235]|uniref:alpha/beta hydrolase n=1 Tax=Sphingomonas sp. BK235 TaxID=2512131 RepID=UPI00104A997E|nr:hypothetical protein [Sphingomonas sp. BK235]TCP32441.1 phospholipase/carboxylesterase [Sphingomonas sp. BK235]
MSRPIIVALHGVGSSARDLAAALAPLAPIAEVVALDGCEPFDRGPRGRQWFSIASVTEADRPRRVAGALPRLINRLDRLAADRGVDRHALTLLGFSQGAIMTLAMVAQRLHHGRAIAVAGRLAAPILPMEGRPASVLLVHDRDDPIMPISLSQDAAARLASAGNHVALRATDEVGHAISGPTLSAIRDWLVATPAPLLQSTLIEG